MASTIQVRVPRRPGQKERIATLAVRHTPVTLRPLAGKASQGPLSVWAVEAREVHPPRRVTAICWRLVTTLPVETTEQAVEKVQWYAQRWRIEEPKLHWELDESQALFQSPNEPPMSASVPLPTKRGKPC